MKKGVSLASAQSAALSKKTRERCLLEEVSVPDLCECQSAAGLVAHQQVARGWEFEKQPQSVHSGGSLRRVQELTLHTLIL